MGTEVNPRSDLKIAHVLFIDVVDYTKLLIEEQRERQERLNSVVRKTKEFRAAEAEVKLVRLPTGDGMALVFFTDPEAPVNCALEIAEALQNYPDLKVRMGINTGPVSSTLDVNDHANVAGAGINMAKRIMDCGDAGHILLSRRSADDLSAYRQWKPHLHPLGDFPTKHEQVISLVSLYTDRLGNPELPSKLAGRQSKDSRRVARRRNLGLGLVALLTAGISIFFLFRAPAMAIDKSIAVLPFQNLSDSQENAYFAGGIQDDVLTNLSKISELRVISRTSVQQFADGRHSAKELRKVLGVGAVLEGSVRRIGDRVRVNVQLINTASDQHIWAESYERSLTDVFAIQSELALQIASTLQTKLSSKERARLEQKPTENSEAYLTYLQAQDILTRSTLRPDLDRAVQLYRKAIELDPSFALAFARLSYLLGTIYQVEPAPGLAENVQAAANESLRLKPDLPEGHLALGYYHYRIERDYAAALRELETAKAGLPNDAEVFLVLGSIKRRQANWSGSITDYEKATKLDPRSSFLWVNLGGTYRAVRDFPAAAKAFAQGTETDPTFLMSSYMQALLVIDWNGDLKPMERLLSSPPPRDPRGSAVLARFELHLWQRKFEEAVQYVAGSNHERFSGFRSGVPLPRSFLLGKAFRLLKRDTDGKAAFQEAAAIVETSPKEESLEPWRAALLGQIYAGLGRRDDATNEARRALDLLPESRDAYDAPAVELKAAEIHAAVGNAGEALRLLEHSLATNSGVTVHMLRLDPAWDPLRDDPRFQKLVESDSVEARNAEHH